MTIFCHSMTFTHSRICIVPVLKQSVYPSGIFAIATLLDPLSCFFALVCVRGYMSPYFILFLCLYITVCLCISLEGYLILCLFLSVTLSKYDFFLSFQDIYVCHRMTSVCHGMTFTHSRVCIRRRWRDGVWCPFVWRWYVLFVFVRSMDYFIG